MTAGIVTAGIVTAGAGRSALYRGAVVHERLRPRRHRLRYRAFWLLFDLDELPALGRSLMLFGYNRPGLFSFHDRDHGDGSDRTLRRQVDALLDEAGLETGGAIRLFCLPRILGYGFNPISLYFCHARDGALAAMLYEVNNTFGERHSYFIAVDKAEGGVVRQSCAKRLYVSPFMDMAMTYDFRVRAPAGTIDVAVDASDRNGVVIKTALHGRRAALTDRALMAGFLAFPWLTLKVIAAIHWEALRLWVKGVKMTNRPPGPQTKVTVAPQPDR